MIQQAVRKPERLALDELRIPHQALGVPDHKSQDRIANALGIAPSWVSKFCILSIIDQLYTRRSDRTKCALTEVAIFPTE